jgi:hypothetical protein
MSGHDFVATAPKRPLLFKTCREFMTISHPFSGFVPVPELARVIEAHHRERQVGVHIRRTDNIDSIRNSPTRSFVELLEAEVRADPAVVFFLATDSPEEERLLRERFPGRVQVHPKTSLNRGEGAAARDALVDLYALAGCRKIIGSYWSSFTDVASRIHGVERIIVKES